MAKKKEPTQKIETALEVETQTPSPEPVKVKTVHPKGTTRIKVDTSALPTGDQRVLKLFKRDGSCGWAGEERLSGDLSAPANLAGLMRSTADCLLHLQMRRHQVRATHLELMELGVALDSAIELLKE